MVDELEKGDRRGQMVTSLSALSVQGPRTASARGKSSLKREEVASGIFNSSIARMSNSYVALLTGTLGYIASRLARWRWTKMQVRHVELTVLGRPAPAQVKGGDGLQLSVRLNPADPELVEIVSCSYAVLADPG